MVILAFSLIELHFVHLLHNIRRKTPSFDMLHWGHLVFWSWSRTHSAIGQVRAEHGHLTLVLGGTVYHRRAMQDNSLWKLVLLIHVEWRELHHPLIILLIRPVQRIKFWWVVHLLDMHFTNFGWLLHGFDLWLSSRNMHLALPVLRQAHGVMLWGVLVIIVNPGTI